MCRQCVAKIMQEKITSSLISSLSAKPPVRKFDINDTKEVGLTLSVLPSGVMSFSLRYRNSEGRQLKYTIGRLGVVTLAQARKIAGKLNGQVKNGIDIQAVKKEKKVKAERRRQQTLGVFFHERYKPYLVSHTKTGEKRAQALESSFIKDWSDKPLIDINDWLVISWRKSKLKTGLKPGGVNRPVSALKAMLNRAVDWNILEKNPLERVKPIKEGKNPIVRYLTEDEEHSLRRALLDRQQNQVDERRRYNGWLNERNLDRLPDLSSLQFTDYLMPMVLLALNTGMRRGELFSLCGDDFDFKSKQVRIKGTDAKSGNTRHIPLTHEGQETLRTWIRQNDIQSNDLVFPSPVTGQRFDNIKRSWTSLIGLAGIDGFRFHDLRHSYASKLVRRGADLYVVKELLGHASIETTQRYSHLAPDHKARTVELLNV